jgi:hypothetical protein
VQKRSLHVGLNYPGTSAELYGCVNDANDWAAFFGQLGYTPTTITEPTGDAMLDAIVDGLEGLRWGDRFVFTYSGHGSFVPDRDGDEVDGFDEVLCPSDFRQRLVTDDELATVLNARRAGVRATFLPDSCHSGSVSRFVDLNRGRARFMPPAMFLGAATQAATARALDRGVRPMPFRVPAVSISGCADHEYSYDATFGGRPNGAFTRVAIDAYAPGQTMIGWFRTIRTGLPTADFPQSPHLTARLHQRYWKL